MFAKPQGGKQGSAETVRFNGHFCGGHVVLDDRSGALVPGWSARDRNERAEIEPAL